MKVKTHLIVKDQWDEYKIKWVRRLLDTKPKFTNGVPIFVITAGGGRIELNTINMAEIEKWAKRMTRPRGRGSLTSDTGYIFVKEEKDEVLLGIICHDHVRQYAPMYDEL